jgi:hypothetical protein
MQQDVNLSLDKDLGYLGRIMVWTQLLSLETRYDSWVLLMIIK